MRVSVIIPTYNEEGAIGECLGSLAKQTYSDLEVIVVDDGSTDNTLSEIQNSASKMDALFKIRNFHQQHKGPGAARNFGAKHANGEILVFVDADMTFHKDFIKKLTEPIILGKTIGTFSKEEYLANKENIWARCWNINRGFPPERMHHDNYPNTQKVFRAILKKEFERAGGFDENAGYIDDWSLSDKLGIGAVNAPGAIFYHNNPSSLIDVFVQSRWMAKRKYKLGPIGYLINLVRSSFPISVCAGILLATYYMLPAFLIFKLVSDIGQFIGTLEFFLFGKVAK